MFQSGKSLLIALMLGLSMMVMTTGCSGGGEGDSGGGEDAGSQLRFDQSVHEDLRLVYEYKKMLVDATAEIHKINKKHIGTEDYVRNDYFIVTEYSYHYVTSLEDIFYGRDFDYEVVSANTPGEYYNPEVQEMYDTIIEIGSISINDCFEVFIIAYTDFVEITTDLQSRIGPEFDGFHIIIGSILKTSESTIPLYENLLATS